LFEHAQHLGACLLKDELATKVFCTVFSSSNGAAGVGDGPFVEARLDERAEVLRLFELVEQPENGLMVEVAMT
jgi:hypothetical protein